jgi:hypothetical protein
MSRDVGAVPFIDACTMSSAIVTDCAGPASPGRHPLSTNAPWSAVSRPGGSSGRLISMAIASWPDRRVACVAGTGSKPGTASPQPRELAAARRRAQQRADRASWLPDPLGQLRVLARSGGHGRDRLPARPAVATTYRLPAGGDCRIPSCALACRIIWRRSVALRLPSGYMRSRDSSQLPYSA